MEEMAEEVEAVVEERGRDVGVIVSGGGRGTDSTIFWAEAKALRR
jgi:dihydrodipicolinate synthase/N-acetylneuraminate lyase